MMRVLFSLCFTAIAAGLTACSSPSEEGGRPQFSGPGSGKAGVSERSLMWAEPAALFLVGLEGDGSANLTHARFLAAQDALWVSADSDGDNGVRTLELQAWRGRWFGANDGWPGLFHFDTNSDETISKGEFRTGLLSIFTTFDKNKDGVIERSELLEERRMLDMHRGAPHGEPGKPGGESGPIPGGREDRGTPPPRTP
jgi:hypothetical protein